MQTRTHSIRHTLQLTIGGLTALIVVLVAGETGRAWQKLASMQALENAARVSDELFTAVEMIAAERSVAFSMLHATDAATTGHLRDRLALSRQAADAALERTEVSLREYAAAGLGKRIAARDAQASVLAAVRSEVDHAARLPLVSRDPALAGRWFEESTKLIAATEYLWVGFDKAFSHLDPFMNLRMRFKHTLRVIAEYTARQEASIGRLIVQNAPPSAYEQTRLVEWHGRVGLGWETADMLADQNGFGATIVSYLADAESHYSTLYDMVRDVFYRPGVVPETPYPIGIELWLELSTQVNDSLDALRRATLRDTQTRVEVLAVRARRGILVCTLVLAFALGLSACTFFILARRVLGPIDDMVSALLDATDGKVVTYAPRAGGEQDEIGKLAHVLDGFQRNTEEIKRGAKALEAHAQALERSNKELDDFAYIASHDLKEPLRGIHNHARFLLDDNRDKLDADSTKRLFRLVYLSQRMERLVNDLLYFSRLGRQELAVKATDLNGVIRDIAGMLESTLEEKRARIRVPAALPTVTCDMPRITEVFRNLITNAIKYNDKPVKLVEVGYLQTRAQPSGETARDVFYVRDNGVGIAPEFHEEIFRIFKRLQRSQGEEEGTGVGLTFVKKIVERHGGTIWLESQPGQGTTFYFTLGAKRHDTNARAAA